MSNQTWLWANTDFVEVDYVPCEPYSFSPTKEVLSFLYIRSVEVDYDIYSPNAYDDIELSKPHNGTEEGVINAVKEEFGVTLKPRPDLGVVIFEIVDGV